MVVALVAAACGSDNAADTTSTTTSPTNPTTTSSPTTAAGPATTVAGDPDRLILQFTDEGGFVPIEFLLNRMPRFSLYADGTLLSPGVSIAIFPGPILSPVQSVQISEGDLDDMITLIEAIGLPTIDEEIDDTLTNRVADATIATYFDTDGGAHTYGACALGLISDQPAADATLNLGSLMNLLDGFIAEGIGGGFYKPDRFQLHLNETPFVDPDLSETMPWPLDIVPDDFGQEGRFNRPCAVLTGGAATAALTALAEGNQATIWDLAGTELQILARPLLPGEPGCIA